MNKNSDKVLISKGYLAIATVIALILATIAVALIIKLNGIIEYQYGVIDEIDPLLRSYYQAEKQREAQPISIEPLGSQFGPSSFDRTGPAPRVMLDQMSDTEFQEKYEAGSLERFVYYLTELDYSDDQFKLVEDVKARLSRADLYYLTDKYKIKLVLARTSKDGHNGTSLTVSGLETKNLLFGLDDLKVTLINENGTFELVTAGE